jgi:hypothetical protein
MMSKEVIEEIVAELRVLKDEQARCKYSTQSRVLPNYNPRKRADLRAILSQLRKKLFVLHEMKAWTILGYDSFQSFIREEIRSFSSYFYSGQLKTAVIEHYVCDCEIGSLDHVLFDKSGFKTAFRFMSGDLSRINQAEIAQAKEAWQEIKLSSNKLNPNTEDIRIWVDNYKQGGLTLDSSVESKLQRRIDVLTQQNSFLSQSIDRMSNEKEEIVALRARITELEQSLEVMSEQKDARFILERYRDRQRELIPAINEYCLTPVTKRKAFELMIENGTGACKLFLKRLRSIEKSA